MKNILVNNTDNKFLQSGIGLVYLIGYQEYTDTPNPIQQNNTDIEGNWFVYGLKFDNSVESYTSIKIKKSGKNKVTFFNNDRILSEGTIDKNIIKTTNLFNLGIDTIYISTKDCLKSEIPVKDTSKGLVFIKKDKIHLSGNWNIVDLHNTEVKELDPISIKQVNNRVTIWKRHILLAEGFIANDVIYVEDFMGYGISTIKIITNERMENIAPNNRKSSGLIFMKQRYTNLNGFWKVLNQNLNGSQDMIKTLEIIQDENIITIWDEEMKLGEGLLEDEQVFIDDFMQLGISRFFVLSDKEIASEIPLSRKSQGLHLIKYK